MKNIIIIGSRGYGYKYGGWETFVTEFVNNYKDMNNNIYVPSLTFNSNENLKEDNINNLHIINLYTKSSGSTTMFKFTIKSMNYYINYIKKNKLKNVFMIILGCKIGPFMPKYYKSLHALGVKIIMNPDGLEWKRDKWNTIIKAYFKTSEKYHVIYSDALVCDSKAIKDYIDSEYNVSDKTNFIAYGAYLDKKIDEDEGKKFFIEHNIKKNNYYLIVGRFVPENNIEYILKEFINSNTKKELVIVTNVEHNSFYDHLIESTHFDKDKRINLVGPVYDKNILSYLRLNAYAYIHGHSAGGTNPSLLEALSLTKLNLLYDISYNKEVGENSCLYFNKTNSNLAKLINKCDKMKKEDISEYSKLAKNRIKNEYTWDIVIKKYNDLFDKLEVR